MGDSTENPKRPDHMVKADLVEDVVAIFHEADGVTVETKVLLPSRRNPQDRREIDVLLTGNLASYPIRVGIECKNYSGKIGTGRIDEFAGKLNYVGIPCEHGIFVSVNGYSRGVVDRARDLGIRLLTLEGLTPDRLNSVVHQVFQSIIYLLLSIDRIEVRTTSQVVDPWTLMWTKDANGQYDRGIFDIVWGMWRNGKITRELGQRTLPIDLPSGWTWHNESLGALNGIDVTIRVRGLILTLTGAANQHTLTDVLSPDRSRTRIAGSFEADDMIPVTVVDDESDLHRATEKEALINFVVGRIALPRVLVLNSCYWPPSQLTVDFIARTAEDLFRQGDYEFSGMSKYNFMDIEGPNLSRVWEPIWSEHPGAADPEWPFVVRHPPRRQRIRRQRPSINHRRKKSR